MAYVRSSWTLVAATIAACALSFPTRADDEESRVPDYTRLKARRGMVTRGLVA
jgi:hypothetical protein